MTAILLPEPPLFCKICIKFNLAPAFQFYSQNHLYFAKNYQPLHFKEWNKLLTCANLFDWMSQKLKEPSFEVIFSIIYNGI
jgi:hypothetical protein